MGPGGRRAERCVNREIFASGAVLEDNFRILHQLGSGSMGVVYLAEDLALQRSVALKVLACQYEREPDLVEKFRREAIAMAAIRHQNVVQIHSYGTQDGHSFFVMEYIEGRSLADLIEERANQKVHTPLDEAVGILTQACRGVGAIHRKNIVHRDLKPANILLGEDYRVAVTDFGLVRPVERIRGQTLDLDGTPMYLAPERIEGKKLDRSQAHLCDIYSLGAIFHEVLTGCPPYESDSVVGVLDSHLADDPPTPSMIRPELPGAIDYVVHRAMAKDPRDRFASCREMERALRDGRTAVAGPDKRAPAVGAHTKMTFVVIDGDAGFLERLHEALERLSPQSAVYPAQSGEQGLLLAHEAKADVVVCAQDAPHKNALEICSSLIDERGDRGPQVLVLGRKVDRLQKGLFQELGARDMLRRGDEPDDLARRILALVAKTEEKSGYWVD